MITKADLLFLLLDESNDDLPSNYPPVKLPADVRELQKIYKIFNQKYFNNELNKIMIKLASSKKWWGLHTSRWDEGSIKSLHIKINKLALNNRKKLINTLLHEMIHEWEKEKFRQTGDKSYLDAHGKMFQEKMKLLNNFGFDINLKSSEPSVESGTIHGIMFTVKDDSYVVPFVTKSKLKEEAIKQAISSMQALWRDLLISYEIIETNNAKYAITAYNMSPKGTFRVKRRVYYASSDIRPLITKPTKSISLESDSSRLAKEQDALFTMSLMITQVPTEKQILSIRKLFSNLEKSDSLYTRLKNYLKLQSTDKLAALAGGDIDHVSEIAKQLAA